MGGGVAALNELTALVATGHAVTVLTPYKPDLPREVNGQNLDTVNWICPLDIHVPHPPYLTKSYLQAQWRLIQLTRRIQKLKPSLIIVQGVRSHRRLESYRSWGAVPRVMTIHGTPDQSSGIYHDGINHLPKMCAEMATYDGFIQLSPRVADKWKGQPGQNGIPAHIIPNTLNESECKIILNKSKAECRKQLGLPKESKILVCTASVQYRKGQDLLIPAMGKLVKAFPDLHLYLVGPVIMGWGGREIKRMAGKSPAAKHIHFVGSQPKETALMYTRAADCFVLPSREEAMPLSILEAMYLETPVVASDVDGIPDEIEHGKSGLLFSHSRPEDLADCLRNMFADSDIQALFASKAVDRYHQMFDRHRYFDRVQKLVDSFIQK